MDSIFELETFKVKLKAPEPAEKKASSDNVVNILKPIYADLDADQEHFVALFLNNKNMVRGFKVVASGGQNETVVDPAILFRMALLYGASALVVAHNHPSGDPQPSPQDIEMTNWLEVDAQCLGMRFNDHIILGATDWYSFHWERETGSLEDWNTYSMEAGVASPQRRATSRRVDLRKKEAIKNKKRELSRAIDVIIEGVDRYWPDALEPNPHPNIMFHIDDISYIDGRRDLLRILSTEVGTQAREKVQEFITALKDKRPLPCNWFTLDEMNTLQCCEQEIVPLIVGFAAGLRKAGISRSKTKRLLADFLCRFAEEAEPEPELVAAAVG